MRGLPQQTAGQRSPRPIAKDLAEGVADPPNLAGARHPRKNKGGTLTAGMAKPRSSQPRLVLSWASCVLVWQHAESPPATAGGLFESAEVPRSDEEDLFEVEARRVGVAGELAHAEDDDPELVAGAHLVGAALDRDDRDLATSDGAEAAAE